MARRSQQLILVVAALAACGGAALGAGTGDESAGDPMPGAQAPVESVDGDVAAGYGVFRRRAEPSDRMDDRAAAWVRDFATAGSGAAAQLARRAFARPDGLAVFVVPGRGMVCHFVTRGEGAEISGGCNRTREALAGYGFGIDAGAGFHRVHGLVPDGVDDVTLRLDDGTAEQARPEGNAFVIETAGRPRAVEWGGRSIPVHLPGD